ncbi:MAG: Bax inhibitor-1/YccA family protein [Herminiimonas sp.]|nr:Bax inhibitor-1/YccA family protein [Herminiimonas sp.]
MNDRTQLLRSSAQSATTVIDGAAQRVLRNTYMLLSVCLGFSAIVAAGAVALRLPAPGIIITLVGFYGLLWLIHRNRDSGTGIALLFAMTGFMGYTVGPLISNTLNLPHGAQTVMLALGGTAATFAALSAYALISKRDMSFMGGFLMVGMIVAILASLAGLFLQIPALSLAISALVVLLMSGMILYETSNIVHGGETNYVMATLSLFVSIFNLFTSLLQLLGFASKD